MTVSNSDYFGRQASPSGHTSQAFLQPYLQPYLRRTYRRILLHILLLAVLFTTELNASGLLGRAGGIDEEVGEPEVAAAALFAGDDAAPFDMTAISLASSTP